MRQLYCVFAVVIFFVLWALPARAQKIVMDQNGEGSTIIRDDQGKVLAVVVPVQNPKAQLAVDRNRGKAQSHLPPPAVPPTPACDQPTNLVISDVSAVSETLVSANGFVVLQAFGRHLGYENGVLGLYLLDASADLAMPAGFWDWGSDSRGLPFVLTAINSLIGSGDMVFQAGETITISYDGGRLLTVTMPISLTIPRNSSVSLFLGSQGRLFWDVGLTEPLDGVACP